jgi:hypothetical protein
VLVCPSVCGPHRVRPSSLSACCVCASASWSVHAGKDGDDAALLSGVSLNVAKPGATLELAPDHSLRFLPAPTPRWPDLLTVYSDADRLLFTSKLFSAHVSPGNLGGAAGAAAAASAFDDGGWDVYGSDWRYFFDCMLAPVARQAAGEGVPACAGQAGRQTDRHRWTDRWAQRWSGALRKRGPADRRIQLGALHVQGFPARHAVCWGIWLSGAAPGLGFRVLRFRIWPPGAAPGSNPAQSNRTEQDRRLPACWLVPFSAAAPWFLDLSLCLSIQWSVYPSIHPPI